MGPSPIADTFERTAKARGGHGVRVELRPPVGQPLVRRKFVLVNIIRPEMPVEMPHVLAPADDLSDESLDGGQWRIAASVGVFGGLDGVEGVQHAQVQRDRQQRMRHRPVVAHDRVLVAPEGREPELDEACQRPLRLGGSDGEEARSVGADGIEVHGVEIASHLLVDVVLARLVRRGHVEGGLLLGRRLAVVLVVVPPVADGLVTVHQDAEAAALFAVEILHPEAGPVGGPCLKVLAGQREGRCG